MRIRLLIFFNMLLLSSGIIHADVLPKPATAVLLTDEAAIFSANQQEHLSLNLQHFFDTTGTPIVLVVVQSLGEIPVEDYANKLFNSWGIGNSKDEGVLLLISTGDRKVRIETGYGSEAVITDAESKRIIEDLIVPYFKVGDYFTGINEALASIAYKLEPGFVWQDYIVETKEVEKTSVLMLPKPIPLVWDKDSLLSSEDLLMLSQYLKSNSGDNHTYFLAVIDSINTGYTIYDVSLEYFIQLNLQKNYYLVVYHHQERNFIFDSKYTFYSYLQHNEEKYREFNNAMSRVKENSLLLINDGKVAEGIKSYLTAFEQSMKVVKRKDAIQTGLMYGGVGLFFLLIIIIAIFSKGGSSYSSSGYSSSRSWSSSSSSFSSFSSGSSFGGGSSGGGGASGSW